MPGAERERPDREVGDTLLDRLLEEPAVPELVQADRDVGMPLVPDPDVAGQQAHRHREHRRELELAGLELEHGADALAAAGDRP